MKEIQTQLFAIHSAFADWYNGKVSKDKVWFDTHITSCLHNEFRGVFPDGSLISKKSFCSMIYKDYGVSSCFLIKLKGFSFLSLGKGYWLVRYKELQYENKKKTLSLQTSSVVKFTSGKFSWIEMHETSF